jgi:N4-gp56 family major capsid protein
MADVPSSDVILSAEFTDRLSQRLLIVPDPQFVFARWAYAAAAKAGMQSIDSYNMAMLQLQEGRVADVGALANTNQAMSSGMGGPLTLAGQNFTFPDMMLMAAEAAQPGTTIKLNRPRFTDGATTLANRRVAPQTKLAGNTQAITRDQVDVTIYEYAGPGDSSGNVVPISLSLFAQARSAHDLLSDIGNQLRRDRYKFLDDTIIGYLVAAAESNASGTTRGADVAANSNFVGSGNEPMTLDLVFKAVEQLKTRYVPGLGFDGRYVAVLHPHQIQQLKNDPRYQASAVFMQGYNVLFPGYATTIENVVLCESQRMPTVTNLGAGSVTGYKGVVLGPQALAWALAKDAWSARDKADDFGRFARFVWMAHEGFSVADSTFVQELLTT